MSRRLRRHPTRSLCAPALAIAALLVVSGCSSDSSDGATTAPKKAATTTSTVLASLPPSTTRVPIDPSTIKEGEAGYVTTLAPLIASTVDLGDADGASDCVAKKWVDIIGVKGFAAAGIAPKDLTSPDAVLTEFGVDDDQATQMTAAFEPCGVDLRQAALDQMGADPSASEATRACLEKAVTDEFVTKAFIAGLTKADLDESEFATVQKCYARS